MGNWAFSGNREKYQPEADPCLPNGDETRATGRILFAEMRRLEMLRRFSIQTLGMHTTDDAARKLVGASLSRAQVELAHVSRVTALGESTASIAHEINQPLSAIVTNGQACLHLLLKTPANLAEVQAAVESMIRDALRASEVIRRIRGCLKKTAVEPEPLSINEVIQEVIGLMGSEQVRHQIRLRAELAENLPMLVGDQVLLRQVMLNLILNAQEAMSEDRRHPRELLIRSQRTGPDEVLVTVRDSGIGLDSQTAEHIFDAFFTTKPQDGGRGLGLSISRAIIESHGGRLWATSNHQGNQGHRGEDQGRDQDQSRDHRQGEGQGATFQFMLPVSSVNGS